MASSVALVATQPVWAALIARHRGEQIQRGTWVGIGLAMAGALLLTGVDLSISSRALFGDLLALLGGMLAAAYVTVGADVRRHVSTVVYALACYATAAVLLLGAVRGHGTGAQRLRPGHVAGHRGAGARRAAARATRS